MCCFKYVASNSLLASQSSWPTQSSIKLVSCKILWPPECFRTDCPNRAVAFVWELLTDFLNYCRTVVTNPWTVRSVCILKISLHATWLIAARFTGLYLLLWHIVVSCAGVRGIYWCFEMSMIVHVRFEDVSGHQVRMCCVVTLHICCLLLVNGSCIPQTFSG